ncbi:hypothetical protein [Fluviicola sp.]|uniref:hypothetical protein n=1 Tax=Fluviicola sp. TaxID=1917219 RepID=UPI0031D2275F
MSKVDIITNPLFQTPYAYLQAAGSDGSDHTLPGVHLRWDFLKVLGDKHLAKGNYTLSDPYQSSLGFNRENDFIKIYRTTFRKDYYLSVDFKKDVPEERITGNKREWHFSTSVTNLPGQSAEVIIRFMDALLYDLAKAAAGSLHLTQILNAYTGIVEVETPGKLSFLVEYGIILTAESAGYLRVESVTLPDSGDTANKQVSCRKKFTVMGTTKVSCENIQYTRFDYANAQWYDLRIYCYEYFIEGVNNEAEEGNWELIDRFSLTTDNDLAEKRFEFNTMNEAALFWPKFNEDDQSTREFTVNETNYWNRWSRPGYSFDPIYESSNDPEGLQHFVHTYMKLSTTDERALVAIPSDIPDDPSTQDISYVDMIRLMSLDYHIARVLGLGHLDVHPKENERYVYCFEYLTYTGLEAPHTDEQGRAHLYMTCPIGKTDYKLPAAPTLTPLTYGISVPNGTSQPTLLTDAQGYAPFGNIRFININRGPYNFEKPFGPFYIEPTEFCLCDETQPIAYGLEYKEINEAGYRKPEISHDNDYRDLANTPETMPILEGGTPQIYTHQETEEGVHEYSAYAINWFSRVSPLSNTLSATTTFPVQTNLLPPFNFAVQLIQDEDPAEAVIADKTLILTTPAEQQLLASVSTPDKTLVRTTFDWNHVHHHAHQYADYAEMFFRRQEPLVIKGKISSVVTLPGNRAQITTTSYQITSTFPATTVSPVISPTDTPKFAGAFFNNGQDNFVIENVISGGANPTFVVKQIKAVTAMAPDPTNQNQFVSNETFKSPAVGQLFFAVENMGDPGNWNLKHSRRVYLEKFYNNAKITLRTSPTRKVVFDIKEVNLVSGDTFVDVVQPITNTSPGGLTLEYAVKYKITSVVVSPFASSSYFAFNGNSLADFMPGTTFRVFGSKLKDQLYTVQSSIFTLGETRVVVANIPSNTVDGIIEVVVTRNISIIDQLTNTFVISGDVTAEINLAHCEYHTETDGSISRFVAGGIYDLASFTPLLTSNPNPSTIEGTGFIQLDFQNYDLQPHPDTEISWYKGTVRLRDVSNTMQVYPVSFIGDLANTGTGHLSVIIQDPGFVPKSEPTNNTGADIYTLDLNVAQEVNYHPSYKLYITADDGLNPVTGAPIAPNTINFDSSEILPVFTDPNEGNRQTYMCIRSYDVKNDYESFLSSPVVLLAQKISVPLPPAKPTGPLYATRPDFYGKGTYTFDTKLDTTNGRVPYSVVFYKASEDRLLDILYTKSTQTAIWNDLDALTDPKAKYDPLLWEILFKGENGGGSNPGFVTYTTSAGSFTWPLPDNPDFYLSYLSNKAFGTTNPPPNGKFVYPFDASFNFALHQTFTVYGKPLTAKAILKSAIQDAFIPLNEQPPLYNYLKTGKQTSAVKAKMRDNFGNLLDPQTNDIFPMIRKYTNGSDTYLRYTDYTLDGASKSLYFYRALEMDDKFKFSDSSLPVGPVLMVNAAHPLKPQIKKLVTRLRDDIQSIPSSIAIELNDYPEIEKISKMEIYRAFNETDALSIRTMKKAKSLNWGDPFIDDFTDLTFPPYGEELHYRLVAIREIEDVEDVILAPQLNPATPIPTVIVDLPSLPSNVAKTLIVDVVNPPAPVLTSQNGYSTPTELQHVILKWKPTCYNGTYRLQKLNESGNWVEFYSTKVTSTDMQYPPTFPLSGPDFTGYPETVLLPRVDADGNPIYHRYRVQVENSSGLFNLSEFELTLAKGASDLQEIDSVLSYDDGNGNSLSVLNSASFISGASQPDYMTFTHLNGPLPAGHNSFVKIEITVTDDLGNSHMQTITNAGDHVVFYQGDGGLELDGSNPNRTYTVQTKLFTDFAVNGAVQRFTMAYLAGPCYDLKQITSLVKLEDSTGSVIPLVSGNINNGVAYPTQLKFTDIADLAAIGQTFNHTDITVTDDLGNTFTQTIQAATGSVIFQNGDGGLVLDNSNPSRNYTVNVKLISNECSTGNETSYSISYTYTPCDDLALLTGMAAFGDNNGTAINPLANHVITSVTHPNGSITLTDLISGALPSGHTFDHMDVILEDDLGGAFIKTISTAAGSVTFNQGDGNLVLDNSNPHRTYFVTLVLYTDLCSSGRSYTFTVKY